MYLLTNENLSKVTGGVSYKLLYVLAGVGTFIAGIISGIINPKSCN